MGLWNTSLFPKQRSHKNVGWDSCLLFWRFLIQVCSPPHPAMNNSGAELSSYFMWILVQKKKRDAIPHSTKAWQCQQGCVKKKRKKKKITENESGWGWRCVVFVFFLYQQSCGLLPHKTKLVIGFGRVPFLLCLTVKVEL